MGRKRRHQHLFERAIRKQVAGQLDQAAKLYTRLLQDRPGDHEALHQLGLVRLQQGDVEAAMEILEDAAMRAPDEARYHANLGNAYQAAGRPRAAIGALERAVAINPRSAAAWSNLGVAQRNGGWIEDGVASLRRAADLQPDQTAIWQNLGSALESAGDLVGAAEALERAAEQDPRDPETWTALGKVYDAQARRAEAESMYRRATLCDQSHAPAWSNLAGLLRETGRPDEALRACDKAIAADPGLPAPYTHRGLIRRGKGQLREAIADWQQGMRIEPSPEAALNLGNGLFELGQLDLAEGVLRELTQRFPAYSQGWAALGALRSARGDLEEALLLYRNAVEVDPDNIEARYFIDALEGRAVAQAPAAYVRRLFDDYAGRFEQHLLEDLSYNTPTRLDALIGSAPVSRCVDLGCGTGLMGARLRERCQTLMGVDLSARMIDQAREKNIYDDLFVGEIIETLAGLSAPVDLAVAADVLVYFGDVAPLFAAVRGALAAAGRFAFSIERHDGEEDWVLRPTGRYAHRPASLAALARAQGFSVVAQEDAPLRREVGEWVIGELMVLRVVA